MFRLHKVYRQHPALQELVNNIVIQQVELDAGSPLPIFPMPPIQEQAIFFYPHDPVVIRTETGELVHLPNSAVVARRIQKIDVEIGYRHLVVKIGLQPGALYRLSGIPLNEWGSDTEVNPSALWLDNQMGLVSEQLSEAARPEDMVAIVHQWLFSRLSKLKTELPIDKVLPAFLSSQTPENVSQIASLSCVSIRQLERLYQQRIGLTPKFYARLVRFTKAWIMREAIPAINWTSLAHSCGYFDQMHLIRDFKQFGGATPTEIQKQLEQLPVSLQHEVFY